MMYTLAKKWETSSLGTDTSQLQQFLVRYVLAVFAGSELNKESSYPLSKCVLVTANYLLCAFFWVIPRLLNFVCRRFGTLCLFHLHRQVGMKYLPMKMEQSDPRRRHIKFRSRGITHKETYNIQNTARV